MRYVEFNGCIVTAEDDGIVRLDSKLIADAVPDHPTMVMMKRDDLLAVLNDDVLQSRRLKAKEE